jgi:magnesium chelatase family protein
MQQTYKDKISGPILDRIDLWIEVPHVSYETLALKTRNDHETNDARQTIKTARTRQQDRLKNRGISTNASMTSRDIEDTITLNPEVETLLKSSAAKLNLSPRSYHRLIKVAQTIADLDGVSHIEPKHILEALQYRVRL